MKKLLYSVLIVTILSVMVTSAAFAGETISPKILAGQNTFVGTVRTVGNDDGSMTFTIMLKAGYCLTEWALHVGDSLDDFPQTPGGNAIPGQFDYKFDPDGCVKPASFTLTPEQVPGDVGDEVWIAVHVVVLGPGLDPNGETGWVVRCGALWENFFYIPQFPGDNWSAFYKYMAFDW